MDIEGFGHVLGRYAGNLRWGNGCGLEIIIVIVVVLSSFDRSPPGELHGGVFKSGLSPRRLDLHC